MKDSVGTQTDRNHQWAAWSLRCWSEFPADASPRPLILFSTVVFVAARFATAEAQTAFRRGNVTGSGAIPEAVLEVVREQGDVNAFGLPARPLEITCATRARAEFRTDRGPRLFEAWEVSCSGIIGKMFVLDPEIAAMRWEERRDQRPAKPFQGEPRLSLEAVGHPDSAQLEVSLVGGLLDKSHYLDAEVMETKQAIAVIPIVRRAAGTLDQSSAMKRPRIVPTVGIIRHVKVTLARPLGGRVLVDYDGSPCVVSAPGQGREVLATG
jgi:hypothetical protein